MLKNPEELQTPAAEPSACQDSKTYSAQLASRYYASYLRLGELERITHSHSDSFDIAETNSRVTFVDNKNGQYLGAR